MKFWIGGTYGITPQSLDSPSLAVCGDDLEDDRTLFEIRLVGDGKSIEIVGVRTVKVNGVLYSQHLQVIPRASNAVLVSLRPCEDLK